MIAIQPPVHIAARHIAQVRRPKLRQQRGITISVTILLLVIETVDRKLDDAAILVHAEIVQTLAIDVLVIAVEILLDEVSMFADRRGGRRHENVMNMLVPPLGSDTVFCLLPDLLVIVVFAGEPAKEMLQILSVGACRQEQQYG